MINITLVSLLHQLSPRFPIYSINYLLDQLAHHQGDIWLPHIKGEDVAALRQHPKGKNSHPLTPLSDGWCHFPMTMGNKTAELDALASYDTELMENLTLYWRHPDKINSLISDNLFELRRNVVDEAYQEKLTVPWISALSSRVDQVINRGANGTPQLCFVEIESAYWLRHAFSERDDVTLHSPTC